MHKILKINITFLLCLSLSAFTFDEAKKPVSTNSTSNDSSKSDNILNINPKDPIDAEFIKIFASTIKYKCDDAANTFNNNIDIFRRKNGLVSIGYRILSGCYETTGKYNLTAQYYKKYLVNDGLDENISYKYYSGLAKLPEMKLEKNGYDSLKLKKNNTGTYEVGIKINNKNVNAILDTGANGNFISRTKAKEMGLDFYGIGSNTYTAAVDQINNEYAIAKNLEIGGNIFSDILFIVIDDEKLSFSHKDYNKGIPQKLDLVIGFPVFFKLGAIEFTNSTLRRVDIDKLPNDNWTNLKISRFNILIPITINGIKTDMQIDTGASDTILGQRFIEKNNEFVKNLTKEKYRAWGVGGVIENEAFLLQNPKIEIGKNQITLDKLFIVPSNLKYDKDADGLFGLDIITQYESFTIDLQNLKMRFGNQIGAVKK